MIKYQYQVIRYTPDHFTGEFANIGIILYSPETNFLGCKVTSRYARLSEFFGEVHGTFLLGQLRLIESRIKTMAEDFNGAILKSQKVNVVSDITSTAIPKNDGALQLSEVITGVDIDPEITLHDLFERIIERYYAESPAQKHTDSYAWKNIYKSHFDKYGISKRLKKHTVNTKKDTINFDKAWKNGVWNCYQTLAFDLTTEEAIKSKVYKWSGIIDELRTTKEKLNVYFLTTSPKQHKELKTFIKEKLKSKGSLLKIDLIDEKEADSFARKVRRDMEKSRLLESDDFLF